MIYSIILAAFGGVSLELPPVDAPISVITFRLANGALRERGTNELPAISDFELKHPDGPFRALLWLGGYITNLKTTDYINYTYLLGFLNRETFIENDHVVLTTRLLKVEQGLPIYITIIITATETPEGTILRGEAYGRPNYMAFRCPLKRRIAKRRAPAQINAGLLVALHEIRQKGTDLYQLSDFCVAKVYKTTLYRRR